MKKLIDEIEKLDKLTSLLCEVEDVADEIKKLGEFAKEYPEAKDTELFKAKVKVAGDRAVVLLEEWVLIRTT